MTNGISNIDNIADASTYPQVQASGELNVQTRRYTYIQTVLTEVSMTAGSGDCWQLSLIMRLSAAECAQKYHNTRFQIRKVDSPVQYDWWDLLPEKGGRTLDKDKR
jgi:hypothetical protein